MEEDEKTTRYLDEDDDLDDFEDEWRSEDEIIELESEAFDRVWADRSSPTDNPEIEEKRQKALKEVIDKYDDIHPYYEDGKLYGVQLDTANVDFYHGFWSGILAGMRWVMGDEKWDLDT